ncbi:uncharacterized protein LOC144074653 isoform X2 [Stigmatopora argus]
MLKELVRERLLAAADEIFQLFEGTIATYKEQVCRAKEESERHRRELEAVCKTQIDRRVDDVQQLKSQQDKPPPPHQQGDYASLEPPQVVKEEKATQKPHIQDDAEDPQHSYFTVEYPKSFNVMEEDDAQPLIIKEEEAEADIKKFPLLSVCVKSENNANEPSEWLQLLQHSPGGDHCGRAPPDDIVPPISDSYDTDTGRDETTPPFQMKFWTVSPPVCCLRHHCLTVELRDCQVVILHDGLRLDWDDVAGTSRCTLLHKRSSMVSVISVMKLRSSTPTETPMWGHVIDRVLQIFQLKIGPAPQLLRGNLFGMSDQLLQDWEKHKQFRSRKSSMISRQCCSTLFVYQQSENT